MLVPFLIFDGVRYGIATGVMVLYDALVDIWKTIFGIEEDDWYCPTVAVMIVGLNEGDTIAQPLESVYTAHIRKRSFLLSMTVRPTTWPPMPMSLPKRIPG